MTSPEGLIGCGADWGSAFCITKTLETFMSLLLIVWIIIEMVNYYHYVRVIKSSFILIVEILMLLTLTFNIAFAVYHQTYALLYLQIYFTNMYFVVLCYYLIYNVFKRIKWMRTLIACFIGFLSLIFLLVLIDSFIQDVKMCKELSYLVVNSLGLFACMIMFGAYRYNEIKEKKRIQKFNKMLASDQIDLKETQDQNFLKMKTPSKVNFNTPFYNMWLMIICNIICRLVGLGQTLAFQLDWTPYSNSTCPISQNESVNYAVNLIFVTFTIYLGFVATIYVFRQKRKAKDEFQTRIKTPSQFSNIDSGKNLLQMVGKDSFSIFYSNSNDVSNLSQLYQKCQNHRKTKTQVKNK